MMRRQPRLTLFPYTTLFRSREDPDGGALGEQHRIEEVGAARDGAPGKGDGACDGHREDRKSTRLNSSHTVISYAVFCLKKKKNKAMMRYQDSEKRAIRTLAK